MKKLLILLIGLFIVLPALVNAQSDSYLETIYQANDQGTSNEQCTPGVDCPEDGQCVGDECKSGSCEGEECSTTCEGDECKSPECTSENCPDGECVDGKCVPKPEAKLANMLKRIQDMLNNLINQLINRIMGVKVGINIVDMKKVAKPVAKPDPVNEPEPVPEPGPEPVEEPKPVAKPEPAPTPEPEPEPEPEASVYKEYTDFDAAKAAAKAKDRPIMMVFSGSDWCGWCKKFDAEIRKAKAFQDYAKDNMETFIADFPRYSDQPAALKAQNQALMQKYGVSGFPTVLIVNPDGSVIKKTGYIQGGAENYVNHLKQIIE
ncbi:MAG: thioredoxin family protein [Candidatus Riflebacteria bacterium]